jgi:hypothetical protein
MEPHPFDVLGLVPSLSCTRDELLKAKRAANFTLTRYGGLYSYQRNGIEYKYTASNVNDCADMLEKVVEAGALMFRLLEWGPYTSNWNPQTTGLWSQPIPGWEAQWETCCNDIHRLQQDLASWEVLKRKYMLREVRQELGQKIELLNEEAAAARRAGEAAERGRLQAVADLTEERNRHEETAHKLKQLEEGRDALLQRFSAESDLLEKDREEITCQFEQLDTDKDLLRRARQQLEADRDQLRQDKEVFALLHADHGQFRQQMEAFHLLHQQVQTDHDREREAFHLLHQQLQTDRDQLLQEREALGVQRRQLEEERDTHGRHQPFHSLEGPGEQLATQDGPRREAEENTATSPTQERRKKRQARSNEGLHAPSEPQPSQAPTSAKPFCIELGKSSDGLAVWGGINKRGRVYRRVRGNTTGSSSIGHSDVIYNEEFAGGRQEDVDGNIRNSCRAQGT